MGAGYLSPTEIRAAIKKIRALTDKPFAVNLFIPEQHAASGEQLQQACLQIEQACHELNLKIMPATNRMCQIFKNKLILFLKNKFPFLVVLSVCLIHYKTKRRWHCCARAATTLMEANL